MNENEYIPRLVDRRIREKLENFGAVNIEGCKWCGKTRTAREFAKSSLDLQDTENKELLTLIRNQPSIALRGEKPRLIDEWQDVVEVWDAIRYDVDRTGEVGQYILTGSATPRTERPRHSGAGRIANVTMRPMALYESGESSGEVSLGELFNGGGEIFGEATYKVEDIAYLCARGGWPSSVTRKVKNHLLLPREYLKTIIEREDDFGELDFYSPEKMRALMRSLARNTATPLKLSTIKEDMASNSGEQISDVTLANYMTILEQIHLVEDVPAWLPRLRSKTEMRTARKRSLVDPSLAVASLYASDEDLIMDARTFGFIFETMMIRDLKTLAEEMDGELFYYRDKNGLECDAIIHKTDGRWGAIEIKLGSDDDTIEMAAGSLKTFRDKVDTEKMRPPEFLMVLSGIAKYAYRRDDGVMVVPAGCLGV